MKWKVIPICDIIVDFSCNSDNKSSSNITNKTPSMMGHYHEDKRTGPAFHDSFMDTLD